MGASKNRRKKTAFVPRIIFEAATVAAVIPLCAACSGKVEQAPNDSGADAFLVGVAVTMMSDSAVPLSVAAMMGDGGDIQFSVGASCFDVPGCEPIEAGVADASFVNDADAGFDRTFFGVADAMFAPPDADKG
jgi:hypothetical protein